MKNVKLQIFVALLFIAVGIAAVTTNLIGNVSTLIASNPDDFNVYFSRVLVDGKEDLSLVRNSKTLVFYDEFSAVDDKKVITYQVTNGSRNYDAQLSFSCTESNQYISIVNNFDVSEPLVATSSRNGTLTISLSNAVSEETSYEVTCTINATAVERTVKGPLGGDSPLVRTFNIGDELFIGSERFNVISSTDNTVTMLAQYNLGTDYKQSTVQNSVTFSNVGGWEYTPGPKEIDIQSYEGNAKTYVNEYVSYLKAKTGVTDLTGDLITLSELGNLGCTISDLDDYSGTGLENVDNCVDSPYSKWLVIDQIWWTKSAYSLNGDSVWNVTLSTGDKYGYFYYYSYGKKSGIRPVITMPKSYFQNNMISFTIDGKSYNMPYGSTWKQFIDSDINDTELAYYEEDNYIYAPGSGHDKALLYNPQNLDITNMYDSCDAFDAGDTTEMALNDIIINNGIYNIGDVVCLGGGGMSE